jgi:hypothetical protein
MYRGVHGGEQAITARRGSLAACGQDGLGGVGEGVDIGGMCQRAPPEGHWGRGSTCRQRSKRNGKVEDPSTISSDGGKVGKVHTGIVNEGSGKVGNKEDHLPHGAPTKMGETLNTDEQASGILHTAYPT